MESSSKVFLAALQKYVDENSGLEFYASRIDPKLSYLTDDGFIHLVGKVQKKVHAQYNIKELGLRVEDINEDLKLADEKIYSPGPSDISNEVFSIDLSEKKTLFGVTSSVLMIVGTLCPVATLPFAGTINYVGNGRGDGVMIIVIGVVSVLFTLTQKYRLLRFLACSSLCLMFFTIFRFQFRISSVSSSMREELEGNPFGGIVQAAVSSVGLGWGWILLISGAVMLLLTSFIETKDGGLYLNKNHLTTITQGKLMDNIPALLSGCLLVGLLLAAIFK